MSGSVGLTPVSTVGAIYFTLSSVSPPTTHFPLLIKVFKRLQLLHALTRLEDSIVNSMTRKLFPKRAFHEVVRLSAIDQQVNPRDFKKIKLYLNNVYAAEW